MEAFTYGDVYGFIRLRPVDTEKFRNRGKTRDDFEAEKEAKRINKTSGALEEMLLEYFRDVQADSVGKNTLDELIDTLEEIKDYYCSGKLKISDEISFYFCRLRQEHIHDNGNQNPAQHTDKDLRTGMTDKLLQRFRRRQFSALLCLEHLYKIINHPGLFSRLLPDPGGVMHHDECEDGCDRKQRGTPSAV